MSTDEAAVSGLSSLGLQNRLLEVAVVVGMDEETGLQVRKINRYAQDARPPTLFQSHFQGHLLDILSGPQDCAESSSSWKIPMRIMTNRKTTRPVKSKNLQRSVSVRKLRKRANKHEEVPVSTDFLRNMPSLCLPEDSRVYAEAASPKFHCTVLTDIDGYRHYAAVLTFYRQFNAAKNDDNDTWSLSQRRKSDGQVIKNLVAGSSPTVQICYAPCCICFVSTKPYFSVLKDALSCFYKDLTSPAANTLRKVLEKHVTNLSMVVCPPACVKIRFTLGSLPLVLLPPADPIKPDNIIDLDLRLPLLIFLKQPAELLKVLACIMHEQRIVFLSSDYSLLPLVMDCFRCYIQPMEWHHQYITILFSEIIDFVDCPGIFMMGCHSNHKRQIEKIENDLFLVDLDNLKVTTNSHSSSETDGGTIGQFALSMPELAVASLLGRLSALPLHNSVSQISQLTSVSWEEARERELKLRTIMNEKIQEVFTDFMVDLFGSTLHYMDHERQIFKQDKFLESIPVTDAPFYIKVSKSYMFGRFVKQRLAQRKDHFSAVVEERMMRKNALTNQRSRIRSQDNLDNTDWVSITKEDFHRNENNNQVKGSRRTEKLQSDIQMDDGDFFYADHFSDESSENQRTLRRTENSQDMLNRSNSTIKSQSETAVVTLPAFPVQGTNFNSKHFYQRTIGVINEAFEKLSEDSTTSKRSSQRAGLLLLRGFYKLAEENLVSGLQDLHATAREDARFFPEMILKKVVASLDQREISSIRQHSLYKNLPARKINATRTQSTTVSTHMKSYFSDDNNALYSLKKEPFTYILEKTDVTTDEKVISILYQALFESSNSKEVDPECFNAFFQTWQQLKNECAKTQKSLSLEVRLPLEIGDRKTSDIKREEKYLTFSPGERILKISGMVSSNKGNGRLVLTIKRLMFINAGNQECKFVINLDQILTIKEGKMKHFLTSINALLLHYQSTKKGPTSSSAPLKLGLKSDCDLWMHLINEMKTGHNLSRDQRDDNVTVNAAAQNVEIANAYYSAAEELTSLSNALTWVAKLCRFEALRQSGELKAFSKETQEKMVMRMDPSPKESKKSGICALTYTSAGIYETPYIWVALSSGKLKLVDTTNWSLDPRPIKDWDTTPNCLCVVQEREIWMGGNDSTIYIISVSTMQVTRILNDHATSVLAIINLENNMVASASKTGEVIIWIPEPTKISQKFNAFSERLDLVALSQFKNYLCCCSSLYLVICTYEGNPMFKLELGGFSTIAINSELTCCTCEENGRVWAGDSSGFIFCWMIPEVTAKLHRSSSITSFAKQKVTAEVLKPKVSGMISQECRIICIVKHDGNLWFGNEDGNIIIFDGVEWRQELVLAAHDGPVTSLCRLENRYMISGSGKDDGKIVVWRQ